METHNKEHTIRDAVAEKIASGAVTMRSPFHFVAKSVLLIVALLGVFIVSTLIVNFILFSIHVHSHIELLGFGFEGWLVFLRIFPWFLVCIDIVLMIFVTYLLQSFRFGYKTPALYLVLALAFGIFIVGMVIEERGESMNTNIMRRVEERRLPPPFPFFLGSVPVQKEVNRDFCLCKVISLNEYPGLLIAEDARTGETLRFRVQSGTRYATTSGLVPGELIVIAGVHDGDGDADDVIEVFGIKRLQKDDVRYRVK